jgi:hypothetical protein
MGHYEGGLEVRVLAGRNGRWFCLLSDLSFVDEDGTRHTAEAGTLTDFGSVPRLAWALFPTYGKHTPATVIHDDGCQRRQLDSATVHAIFRRGLKACGCSWFTVTFMWLAVRLFGPRFNGLPAL